MVFSSADTIVRVWPQSSSLDMTYHDFAAELMASESMKSRSIMSIEIGHFITVEGLPGCA